MDSQPMEIETLYDPDMDTSDTSSDNETDSNYDLVIQTILTLKILKGTSLRQGKGHIVTFGNIFLLEDT